MGDDFWHGLHHAMAILGAAAPIAYLEGIQTLYIASSFSVGNTYPCASDPTTMNFTLLERLSSMMVTK